MKKKERISIEIDQKILSGSPFENVDFSQIKLSKQNPRNAESKSNLIQSNVVAPIKKNRVDIRREKSGRGGKIVTIIEGISSIEEQKELLKIIQKRFGCGGTLKEEIIEIQGDKREEITKILKEQGFRVVMCGG